jgi:CNT family concentrative nucleoside transporter
LNEGRGDFFAVLKSLALQVLLALLLIKLPASQHLFWFLNQGMQVLQEATLAGTSFIFGFLGGGQPPYEVTVEMPAWSWRFKPCR